MKPAGDEDPSGFLVCLIRQELLPEVLIKLVKGRFPVCIYPEGIFGRECVEAV
jgi:hypothetical protein